MNRQGLICILFIYSFFASFVHAKETKGLQLQLISEKSAISPASTFYLGLAIKHDKGFHTYWKNPGIVGVPTTLEWTLPEGFKASAIEWPYPELTKMADYPCYGYERDTLLLVKLTAPASISTNSVKLIATAQWMCCANNCFPGFTTLNLTLPVEPTAQSGEHQTRFTDTLKELPTTIHTLQASLLTKPMAKMMRVHIRDTAKKPLNPIHLFNTDGQVTPDKPHTFEKQNDGSVIYVTERSKFAPKESLNFPFVIQTKDGYFSLTAK